MTSQLWTPLQLVNQLEVRLHDCNRSAVSLRQRLYVLRNRELTATAQVRATITAYNAVVDRLAEALEACSNSQSLHTCKALQRLAAQSLHREDELRATLEGLQPTIFALLQDTCSLQTDVNAHLCAALAIAPSALHMLFYSAGGIGATILTLGVADREGWMAASVLFIALACVAVAVMVVLVLCAVRRHVVTTLTATFATFSDLKRSVEFTIASINHTFAAVAEGLVTSQQRIAVTLDGFAYEGDAPSAQLREIARDLISVKLKPFAPLIEHCLVPLVANHPT